MRRLEKITRRWITRETVLLFAIALAVRSVASIVLLFYGSNGVPGIPLPTEGDFYAAYVHWLGFVQRGLLPYRDFTTYKLPPLFLYTLYPFFVAGGAQAAAIPIVVSDALTAVVLYLIVKRRAANWIGFAAGLAYALSPLVLYYEGFLWLSSQPMTFFIISAVYLLNEDKPTLSAAALAVAVMFKQEALFVLPAFLLVYAEGYRRRALKGVLVFVAILVAVSLPFLVLAPTDYIGSINYYPIQNIINLGPPEPAHLLASGAAGSIPSNSSSLPPSFPDSCATIVPQNQSAGSSCGTTYTLTIDVGYLIMQRLSLAASYIVPLLLVLFAPVAFVVRRAPNFLQIVCAYSCLAFLLVYQSLVAPSLAYYFVPVYALILASVTDARILAVGVAAAVLSFPIGAAIPEGALQLILPLGSLFLITALQARSLKAPGVTSS